MVDGNESAAAAMAQGGTPPEGQAQGQGADGDAGAAPTTIEAEGKWYNGVDEGYRSLITDKGWESPADVLKSYSNIEKIMGDPLIMPGEDADEKTVNDFYAKLGRPDASADYTFGEMPEGYDRDETSDAWFRETAHKLGLTAKQATQMYDEFNSFQAGRMNDANSETATKLDQERNSLKQEWGAAFEKNMEAAKRAFGSYVEKDDMGVVDALEKQLGYGKTIKLFSKIGEKLMEDTVEGTGTSSGSFVLTPAQAQAKIKELQADPHFINPRTNPARHRVIQDEITRMYQAAYPE